MRKTNERKWLQTVFCVFGLMFAGCAPAGQPASPAPSASGAPEQTDAAPAQSETAEPESAAAEKNGDIVIMYTGDIHCGVYEGFGVIGVQQIRETLEKNGATTLLVDTGDAVQGDSLGTLTKGSAVITLMNDLHYDIAIPGNHEFDYGMDSFFKNVEDAEFPYISCNFNKDGELLFEPYLIKEAAGKKIAFIGVTTPETLTSSNPQSFQDENGNYVYGFMQGNDGYDLVDAIQKNADEAREKGADLVILMAHVGNEEARAPYNFQTIIERTSGIDVVIDGHSHDADQVTMNNKDGNPVIRTASGTKLANIGYVKISGEDGSVNCGLWSWPNEEPVSELLGIENEMSGALLKIYEDLDKITDTVIGKTSVDLTDSDPVLKNSDGTPKRIVRQRETNLADLVADAFRAETGADIALINGGGVRSSIPAGEITYKNVLEVMPFPNELCITEATGQQILDALEWGARALPEELGGFLHPSGMTFEIHADIPSSCTVGTDGMFGGVSGEYRVKNVMVGGEPLDLKRTYTVAGSNYILKNKGDGFGMFGPENLIADEVMVDNQALINFLQGELNGTVGEEYADPYGSGRIIISGLE